MELNPARTRGPRARERRRARQKKYKMKKTKTARRKYSLEFGDSVYQFIYFFTNRLNVSQNWGRKIRKVNSDFISFKLGRRCYVFSQPRLMLVNFI